MGGLLLAPASPSATLADTVSAALANHPSVQAAAAELASAGQGVRLARSAHYPTLDLRLAGGREETTLETPMPAPLRSIVRETDLDREEASLTLRQPLFNGFATVGNVANRASEQRAAQARLELQRNRVAQEAALAHLEVIGARESQVNAELQVAAHERTLEQVASRLGQGVGQRVDVDQAKSRLSRAQQALLQRRQAVVRAEAKFLRTVGVLPDPRLDAPAIGNDVPANEELAHRRSGEARAEFAEAQARVDAAEAQITVAKAGNYPELALELSRGSLENADGTRGLNEDTTAMAILRYNLFRGGGDMARRKAAASARDAAQERRRDSVWQVRQEVAVAWGALQQAEAALPLAESRAQAINSVVESYEAQFNLGRRSLLDVLDAVSEAHEARQAAVQARIERFAAQIQLLAATGTLLSSALIVKESAP